MTQKNKAVKLYPLEARRYQDGVDDVWGIYESGRDCPVAQIRFWDEPNYPNDVIKAKQLADLFAASLDMLDALIWADSHHRLVLGDLYVHSRCSVKVRKAVARATGGRVNLGKKFKSLKRSYGETVGHAFQNVLEHFLPERLQAQFEKHEAHRRSRIFKDLQTFRKWLLHQYRMNRDQANMRGGHDA